MAFAESKADNNRAILPWQHGIMNLLLTTIFSRKPCFKGSKRGLDRFLQYEEFCHGAIKI